MRTHASLLFSITVLRAFILSCVALLQLKGYVAMFPMFPVLAPVNQARPVSLLSFVLPYKIVLHAFFHSFILSQCYTVIYTFFLQQDFRILCSVFLLK